MPLHIIQYHFISAASGFRNVSSSGVTTLVQIFTRLHSRQLRVLHPVATLFALAFLVLFRVSGKAGFIRAFVHLEGGNVTIRLLRAGHSHFRCVVILCSVAIELTIRILRTGVDLCACFFLTRLLATFCLVSPA